jgi:hypothetical protein
MLIKLVSATLAVLSLGGSALADETPDPSQVYVKGLSHGGSGCPQGSVGSYISEDGKVFTLSFDAFTASQHRGSDPAEARKFCNITVELNIPQGWQFTLGQVDFRGYANIDAGVKGVVQSHYRFSGGGTANRPFRTEFHGPVSTDYLKQDIIGIQSLVWSACGVSRALNIKADVRLEGNRSAAGLLTTDTIDGEFRHLYGLQWRRC